MPNVSQLNSIKNAKKNLTKFLKALDTVPQEELEKTAQRIYEQAIAQTPYETGKLEKSVYVRVSHSKTRPGLTAGANAFNKNTGYNYAAIQHENEDYEHPIKGKAHYIIDPFKKETALMQRRIRRKLNGSR